MQEGVHHGLFISMDLAVPSRGSSSDSDQMPPRLKQPPSCTVSPPSALCAELIMNMENSQIRGGHGQAESPRTPHPLPITEPMSSSPSHPDSWAQFLPVWRSGGAGLSVPSHVLEAEKVLVLTGVQPASCLPERHHFSLPALRQP